MKWLNIFAADGVKSDTMVIRTLLTGLLSMAFIVAFTQKQQINRTDFYAAMASDKLELINDQEKIVKSYGDGSQGFEGALLMKKAGLLGKASEKLSLFKSGHKLLDNAIKMDEANAELRFLRLMIQENAPKVVKYKGNIDADSELIKQHFNQLHPQAQKAVIEYSKKSKILKPGDF